MSLSKEGSTPRTLLKLPSELILQVMGNLDGVGLARLSQTCKTFRDMANDDKFWYALVNENFKEAQVLVKPSPCKTFRELYIAHHPHWFLLKHRIWFADCDPNGKLIIARFDPSSGSIVASQITAMRGQSSMSRWETSDSVIIHSFHPRVGVDTYQPVVKLERNRRVGNTQTAMYNNAQFSLARSTYRDGIKMKTFEQPGLHSSFNLCRALPDAAITEQSRVWPPLLIPSSARVRNESNSNFGSLGQHPSSLNEICEHAFRVRKWAQYSETSSEYIDPFFPTDPFSPSSNGVTVRYPEETNTFATLPESCYIPTLEKPYQGIFCGDYSGHGCEFLLITQPDADKAHPLPEGTNWLRRWFQGQNRQIVASSNSESSYASAPENQEGEDDAPFDFAQAAQEQIQRLGELDGYSMPPLSPPAVLERPNHASLTDFPVVPTGRLEAIKLTGDPNIPRGKYTFIAPDLGHDGFVRVADEGLFRGARVVRSTGHVAGTGFRNDEYSPSELILVSHDVLAQFWHGSNHISYYKRVSLDKIEEIPY